MSKKKHEGFNSPCAAAKDKLAKTVDKPPPPPLLSKAAPRVTSQTAYERPRSDEELFAEAMHGAARIEADPRGRVRAPEPSPPLVSRREADEAEAYATLADLVDGAGPFSMSDTDEYLEFLAPNVGKQLLRKLRAGDFALQGHVDLHGMTREEAHVAVERFIDKSRLEGKRCVLIVHGRGLNSKDSIPVLKERVRMWLARGRLSKQVLAFTSARQCDGGTGALYVLLRK